MWTRQLDGRVFTFHLAGINNQNFLMRDEETGSFWQQIDGKAVSGPMAGRQLELVNSEELSFAVWHGENPRGTVLLPAAQFEKDYEPKDWEKRMLRAPTVVNTSATGIEPRALMIGMEWNGASRAYPLQRVLDEKLVQDRVGGKAVILVAGPDGKSVRAFWSEIPGSGGEPQFYRKQEAVSEGLFLDSATGGEWNFRGCAISGSATGRCLRRVATIKDYWFDWHLYHPQSTVYSR